MTLLLVKTLRDRASCAAVSCSCVNHHRVHHHRFLPPSDVVAQSSCNHVVRGGELVQSCYSGSSALALALSLARSLALAFSRSWCRSARRVLNLSPYYLNNCTPRPISYLNRGVLTLLGFKRVLKGPLPPSICLPEYVPPMFICGQLRYLTSANITSGIPTNRSRVRRPLLFDCGK